MHTYRMLLRWDRVESEPPAGDCTKRCVHHYDWRSYDAVLKAAAASGVQVLPVLAASPGWAASIPGYQPSSVSAERAFEQFATAAAKRYGPRGSLWTQRPWRRKRPAPFGVRALRWQVWNEPNTTYDWQPGPDPVAYGAMLTRVSRALKAASPRVQVMAAGLPWPVNGTDADVYLTQLLRVPGVASSVDAFAVHPYAVSVPYVMNRVNAARAALDANGAAGKPLWITEIGWASGEPDGWFTVSEDEQASNLRDLYTQLLGARARLGLAGCIWFSYRDHIARPGQADYWGFRSGLIRADGSPKPSWSAFEGIAANGP